MVVPYSMPKSATGAVIIAVISAVVVLTTSTSSSPLPLITEKDDDDDREFECSLPPYDGNDDSTGGNLTTFTILRQISCILTYGGSVRDIIINYTLLILNLVFCVGFVVSITGTNHSYGQQATTTTTTRPTSPTNFTAATRDPSYRQRCVLAFTFVVVFQIGLCLCVGCAGISIIWCSMCGWIMKNGSDKRNVRQQGQPAPHTTQEQQLQEQFIADENSENMIENTTSDRTNPDDGHPVSDLTNTVDLSTTTDHYERFERTWIGRQRNLVICCDILIIVYYAVSSPFITTVAHSCALVLGAILSTMTAGINETNNNSNHNEVRSSLEVDTSQATDPSESVCQPLLTSTMPQRHE